MVLALFAMLLPSYGAFAADEGGEAKAHIKPYGFIRNYAIVDSRKSKTLTEEIFYIIPLDKSMVNGVDVNAVPNFKFQALTTRLGLDVTGYKVGQTKIEGKIEADFYCLNSSGNTPTLRMRLAYMDLIWDYADLRIGQAWHPMAADMPHGINLETGVPFNPFSRTAQIMFNGHIGRHFVVTAGILEQLQYRSSGPDQSDMTKTVASNNFAKHAMVPEAYVGLTFKTGGFLARAGVDMLTIKPRYGYTSGGERIKDMLFTVSPFVYAQYTSKKFQIKAKSVFAQAGEHMQMLSGYAAVEKVSDAEYKYSPLQQSASFVSFQYGGGAMQAQMMLGYTRNFGTIKPVLNGNSDYIYVNSNGFKNINSMFRATPTLIYNLGKCQFALEYNITGVRYGDVNSLDKYGLAVKDLHTVFNHRVSLMTKFTF